MEEFKGELDNQFYRNLHQYFLDMVINAEAQKAGEYLDKEEMRELKEIILELKEIDGER